MQITTGATLSGGTSVTLAPSGITPQKSTFTTPTHSRLEPRVVEFTSSPGTPMQNTPGVARTGLKISFAKRDTPAGCCDPRVGAVILDLGVRWNLNQPESLVDDVIAYIRGLVYTTAFVDAVKKGVLPTT